jgi:hypothetical protein
LPYRYYYHHHHHQSKFVIDGIWQHDPTQPTEKDENGNENNVWIAPSVDRVSCVQNTTTNTITAGVALSSEKVEPGPRPTPITQFEGLSHNMEEERGLEKGDAPVAAEGRSEMLLLQKSKKREEQLPVVVEAEVVSELDVMEDGNKEKEEEEEGLDKVGGGVPVVESIEEETKEKMAVKVGESAKKVVEEEEEENSTVVVTAAEILEKKVETNAEKGVKAVVVSDLEATATKPMAAPTPVVVSATTSTSDGTARTAAQELKQNHCCVIL